MNSGYFAKIKVLHEADRRHACPDQHDRDRRGRLPDRQTRRVHGWPGATWTRECWEVQKVLTYRQISRGIAFDLGATPLTEPETWTSDECGLTTPYVDATSNDRYLKVEQRYKCLMCKRTQLNQVANGQCNDCHHKDQLSITTPPDAWPDHTPANPPVSLTVSDRAFFLSNPTRDKPCPLSVLPRNVWSVFWMDYHLNKGRFLVFKLCPPGPNTGTCNVLTDLKYCTNKNS